MSELTKEADLNDLFKDPSVQKTLKSPGGIFGHGSAADTLAFGALAGGGLGGVLSSYLASQVDKDRETKEDRRKRIMRQALLGTALGGTAGAGLGGMKMLFESPGVDASKFQETVMPDDWLPSADPKLVENPEIDFKSPGGECGIYPWHTEKYKWWNPFRLLDISNTATGDWGSVAALGSTGWGLKRLLKPTGEGGWRNFRLNEMNKAITALGDAGTGRSGADLNMDGF